MVDRTTTFSSTDPLLLEELLEEKKPHLKPVTPKPSHSNETALVILPVQQCLKEWWQQEQVYGRGQACL